MEFLYFHDSPPLNATSYCTTSQDTTSLEPLIIQYMFSVLVGQVVLEWVWDLMDICKPLTDIGGNRLVGLIPEILRKGQ